VNQGADPARAQFQQLPASETNSRLWLRIEKPHPKKERYEKENHRHGWGHRPVSLFRLGAET
jgi:hypothetical protein